MENWGLVTYAENALLYNPITATARNRENVIGTIAHEFAVSLKLNLKAPIRFANCRVVTHADKLQLLIYCFISCL